MKNVVYHARYMCVFVLTAWGNGTVWFHLRSDQSAYGRPESGFKIKTCMRRARAKGKTKKHNEIKCLITCTMHGSSWLILTPISVDSNRLWTTLNDSDSGRLRTTPDYSGRLREALDDSGRLRLRTELVVPILPESYRSRGCAPDSTSLFSTIELSYFFIVMILWICFT